MSRRTDYYHDPAAPTPNSLVPGGSALVTDEDGPILLQRRADSGNWALPGGTMDIGETLGDAVIRETREETGLEVELTGVLGIYTDPGHVIACRDGEIRQEFVMVFTANVVGGELAVSDEFTDLRFVSVAELDDLPIYESVRLRLRHYLERRQRPYIG